MSTADGSPDPPKKRRRRSHEERLADISKRMAKLRAEGSRERRAAQTKRLLGLGRAADAALGDAGDADLARLVVLGRWASIVAAGDKAAAMLDKWASAPLDRQILGLDPLEEPGDASDAG